MSAPRVLPHALASEAGILGGILLRPDILSELPDLEPEDFYDGKHRLIFAAMRQLESDHKPIDAITVERELVRRDRLTAVGGPGILGELALRVPTESNVLVYAEEVRQLSLARAMMLIAGDVSERGFEPELDPYEYVVKAEADVLKVAQRGKTEKPLAMSTMSKDMVRKIEDNAARRAKGETILIGVPTGMPALDAEIGGLPLEVVTVLAARPKMGKSSFALATANACSAAGIGVQVFSTEDGRDPYSIRALARESRVPATRIRSGDLQRGDLGPLGRAAQILNRRDNWRFNDRFLTATEICRELRRAAAQVPNFKLGIVDYLQIVKRNPKLNEDQALREIMAEFAAVAKELKIALLVLSQLNRDLEKREDKRPTTSDLRGSGAIEEIARVILFLYRGSVYYPEPKKDIDYECNCPPNYNHCNCCPDTEKFASTAQIIIGAMNHGGAGRVWVSWDGPTLRLE